MFYPRFPARGDIIGICAPSAGVGRKLESFDRSLQVLKEQGYRILETESVRLDSDRGGSPEVRGQELCSLFTESQVAMVMAASGGDFLGEMLPYTDFEEMKAHPRWLMGASDPTGLLFPYTTLCDVATLYGSNAGSYDLLMDLEESHFLHDSLSFIKGELIPQRSSARHLGCPPFMAERIAFDTPTVWKCTEKSFHTKGRCIGGCIDVLKDLIGTPYDGANVFVDRYGSRDGIIWYFDNFAMSAEVLYRTFLQMKFAGWFRHAKAIIIGRTLFEKSESGMTYDQAVRLAFAGDLQIPVIWEADIGHTLPHMTMINGAILDLDYADGCGSLRFSLE